MKKTVSLLMVVAMLLAILPVAGAAAETSTDIFEGAGALIAMLLAIP